ncbi:nucleotidyltransferase family protein [Pseudoalteromonas sp. MMG013]|uniref:nucleotidyltransferase family protein n=1 Tax=Pseudoalteromonas sp. MMG013 TaxID=2822687 RepID=UPI001B399E9C|nr:nucleotidyltransferase family protein [Pseudoalteromonas sp. MMG013]
MSKPNIQWHKCLLLTKHSIRDAVRTIDESGLQIALVVDSKNTLLGTVTDGDIRRALLKELPLDAPINRIMHTTPLVVTPHISRSQVVHLMKVNKVHKVPIVNDEHQVIGLHIWEDIELCDSPIKVPFVIMAGGLGSRLRPYTNTCPKPMLKVAGKPMLEHIIERAKEEGFSTFIISINYLGEKIKQYFGKGKRWNINIQYLEEKEPLGTAGALAQLKSSPHKQFVVTNGDVMSDLRFSDFLNFHIENGAIATMAVRAHEWQNPFGVVENDGINILGFKEKPIIKSQINAGVYVLNKDAINHLSDNKASDMPQLFTSLMKNNMKTIVFPMHETWADIGKPEDLHKINKSSKITKL